jgi:biotin transporter BioY
LWRIFISKKIGKILPSNLIGKITVILIGFFILAIITGLNETDFIYRFLFYLSIMMSFISVIAYALRAYEFLKWKNDEHI